MKEKIIKTKVGQLFVSYQPAEKIAVFLSGAGSLPTYENFLPVIRKLPKNWGYLTIDYPNAGQSPLENKKILLWTIWFSLFWRFYHILKSSSMLFARTVLVVL